MRKVVLSFVLACCSFGLTACLSSGPTNLERYTLTQDIDQEVFLSTRPVHVRLAPILNQGGVVIEISDVALRPAKNYRYSAHLDSEMRFLFIDCLDKAGISSEYKFDIFLSKFQGSLDGTAKVAFFMQVFKGESEKAIYSKSFSSETAMAEKGYDALVRQLKHDYIALVQQFIADFAHTKSR